MKQYIIHCIGSTRIPYLRKEREGEGEGGIGRTEEEGRKGGTEEREGRGEEREGGKEGQKKVVVFTLAKIVFTNEIRIITNITAVLNLIIT